MSYKIPNEYECKTFLNNCNLNSNNENNPLCDSIYNYATNTNRLVRYGRISAFYMQTKLIITLDNNYKLLTRQQIICPRIGWEKRILHLHDEGDNKHIIPGGCLSNDVRYNYLTRSTEYTPGMQSIMLPYFYASYYQMDSQVIEELPIPLYQSTTLWTPVTYSTTSNPGISSVKVKKVNVNKHLYQVSIGVDHTNSSIQTNHEYELFIPTGWTMPRLCIKYQFNAGQTLHIEIRYDGSTVIWEDSGNAPIFEPGWLGCSVEARISFYYSGGNFSCTIPYANVNTFLMPNFPQGTWWDGTITDTHNGVQLTRAYISLVRYVGGKQVSAGQVFYTKSTNLSNCYSNGSVILHLYDNYMVQDSR